MFANKDDFGCRCELEERTRVAACVREMTNQFAGYGLCVVDLS
jgi:hypothetical protein